MSDPITVLRNCFRGCAFILAVAALPLAHASTLWTGPTTTFSKSTATPSDAILDGKVVLSRGHNDVLFNTAAGERAPGAASPADTMWAFGTLDQASSLTFQSLESLRNGNLAGRILNKPMVVHLLKEDIYLSVTFTAWGQHGAGGFAYKRSTPAAVAAPTVSITSPAEGATFPAQTSFNLAATASVSGGTVTDVEFFAGSTSLGKSTAAPFSTSASIATPGSYGLTAVATASGVAATSAVVNITITAPVQLSISAASVANGAFSFQYSVNPGASYLIQASSNLVDWAPVATNVPASNPARFSETLTTNPARYYRVGQLPAQ